MSAFSFVPDGTGLVCLTLYPAINGSAIFNSTWLFVCVDNKSNGSQIAEDVEVVAIIERAHEASVLRKISGVNARVNALSGATERSGPAFSKFIHFSYPQILAVILPLWKCRL
jgi:hypothetical protein